MSRRILFGSLAALIVIGGGYLQQELRSMSERRGELWRTAAGADFAVYYVAAHVASGEGDGRLYEGTPNASIANPSSPWLRVARANGVGATTPFQYPPFFALLIKPIAKLPLNPAFFLWRQVGTLSILIALYLVLVMVRTPYRWPLLVIAAAATLSSYPFIEMKEMGQVGGILLLLWTGGAYCSATKRPVAGALCFALGTMIKLTPAFVIPLFLLRRQWKWLAAYTGWMAALFAISIWQLGWANHVTFFTQFMPAMSCGFPSPANKSLMNVVQSLYFGDSFRDLVQFPSIPPAVCWIGKALSAGVLALVLVALARRTKDSTDLGFELALFALVSLLISPVTWRHHYILAALPLLWMWVMPDRRDASSARWTLLFVVTVVIGTPFVHAAVQFAPQKSVQLCASLATPAAAIVALLIGLMREPRARTARSSERKEFPNTLTPPFAVEHNTTQS